MTISRLPARKEKSLPHPTTMITQMAHSFSISEPLDGFGMIFGLVNSGCNVGSMKDLEERSNVNQLDKPATDRDS